MAFTDSEKAHIVAKYIETGSITTTRRCLRAFIRRTPPTRNSILRWHEQFLTAGSMALRGISDIPRSTMQRALRKCSFLDPYKMQNLHGITNADKRKRVFFARYCQNQHQGMSEYLSKIVFPDECILHLNGSVNTQNVRI